MSAAPLTIEDRISAATDAVLAAGAYVQEVVAEESARMNDAWADAAKEAADVEAQHGAIEKVRTDYRDRLDIYTGRYPAARPRPQGEAVSLPSPIFQRTSQGWSVSESVIRELDRDLAAAQRLADQASKKLFAGRLNEEAGHAATQVLRMVEALEIEARRLEERKTAITQQRASDVQTLRASADQRLGEATSLLADARRRLPPAMLPWSAAPWRSWSPGLTHPLVLLGELRRQLAGDGGPNHGFGWDATTPTFVSLRTPLQVRHTRQDRETALALARSLVLRALAATPPGKLRLSIFDPNGLGQSVASLLELGEYDQDLIGGKVWSSTEDLRRLLADHTAHIELVIQKYLRADYATIDDFNGAAGEIAEPYRLLVLLDAPSGFDEQAVTDLRRVVENGARCGVSTLLVVDEDLVAPYGVGLDGLPDALRTLRLGVPFAGPSNSSNVLFDLLPETDRSAPGEVVDGIVDAVGRGSQASTASAVDFDRTFELFNQAALEGRKRGLPRLAGPVYGNDPETWWKQSTLDSIAGPIGLRGARDVATLTFDSSDHSGALLVGRPGSGKSTLLHTFIAGITTLYGPDELELHLIDFKEGVEFKVYAAHALPHARTVAIESDREFGVSVLEAIESEMTWRGSLLRGSDESHSSLEALRKATGERLPRILLVFDEFQVLFARNDRLGARAAELLETLIRQGRGFGIHVLLGSQSLAGMDALGSHVPQLLPVRILLPAAEADIFKVLGEANTEGSALTTAGAGILNPAGGAVEANERFRGAVTEENDRRARVVAMRSKAEATGWTRRPVVFEGNAPIPADDTPAAQFVDEIRGADPRVLRLRFGAPMAVTGSADLNIRRESGGNILLVSRDVQPDGVTDTFSLPRAVATNLVASAVAQRARVEIVDFLPVDEGLGDLLLPFAEAGAASIHGRRQAPALLASLRDDVRQRIAEDLTSQSPALLVLSGMHRARDFDADGSDYETASELSDALTEIMRDGPEVGIHTVVWCDTLQNLSRRLPPGGLRELAWRLVGKMSADDSASLIAVDTAASLREQQVIAANEDRGVLQRCTAIGVPAAAWMRELLNVLSSKPTV